jgi:hypothetical protein
MCDRVFVEWPDGTWLSSGYNPDFQANLAEQVAQSGPPSKVEFRAAGTGYTHAEPCEDCGKPYAKCKCDEPACGHPVGASLCVDCDDEDK